MKNIEAIHRLEALWSEAGEDRAWFKHYKMREIAVNFATKLDELEAARPEDARIKALEEWVANQLYINSDDSWDKGYWSAKEEVAKILNARQPQNGSQS